MIQFRVPAVGTIGKALMYQKLLNKARLAAQKRNKSCVGLQTQTVVSEICQLFESLRLIIVQNSKTAPSNSTTSTKVPAFKSMKKSTTLPTSVYLCTLSSTQDGHRDDHVETETTGTTEYKD